MNDPERGALVDNVAIVTGGARGIGAAAARLFAREGAKVIVADLREDLGEALAAEIGGAFVRLDVTDEIGWATAIADVMRDHGRVDILVNSAGVFEIASMAETSVALFRRTVEINQLGVFLGMRSVAPAMIATGGGSIINLSSVGGLIGAPGTMAYSATKWAVRGMSKVAANELAPHRIRVNSVHPGGIDTEMSRNAPGDRAALGVRSFVPMERPGTAEEISRLILFLASDASSYCTGAEFVADGGMTSR